MTAWRRATRALLLCLALPSAVVAQAVRADSVREIPDRRLFVAADLWILAGFTGATVALFPLDRDIALRIRDSALVHDPSVEQAARVIGFLGSPGPFIIGGAMYAVGRIADRPRMAHLAVHGTEAIFAGLVATGLLKTTLGRARPFVSADSNPRDFGLFRGWTADRYQAFPSGHATTVFAVASAVTAEMHGWYPRSTWIVAPVLYGGATLVGLSRMYEDKHWASDVIMGAAIGTFAGLKTVRFTHTRTGNRLDRWLLGEDAPLQFSVAPMPGGALRFTAFRRW